MANQERALGGLLVAVLVMNAALLVSIVFERMQASNTTRLQMAEMAVMGLACLALLRALKVSREQNHRLRKLTDINRLLSD
jgi:hypothetical protein